MKEEWKEIIITKNYSYEIKKHRKKIKVCEHIYQITTVEFSNWQVLQVLSILPKAAYAGSIWKIPYLPVIHPKVMTSSGSVKFSS